MSMDRNAWSAERIARLGYLMGLGWSGERIASEMRTTANNIFRQAQRFGLSFRRVAAAISLEQPMSEMTMLPFDNAARARGISRGELLRRLTLEISCWPALIDNILDDDEERAAAPQPRAS